MAEDKVEADRLAQERRAKRSQDLAAVRYRVATVVKVTFGLLAMVLALGALLVVFGKSVSGDNPVVKAIWDVAEAVDGPFGRDDGVFHFSGENAVKLNALVNWGLAAVIYLIIGNLLRRILTKQK